MCNLIKLIIYFQTQIQFGSWFKILLNTCEDTLLRSCFGSWLLVLQNMVFGVVFKYICWKIQWIIPINNMNQPFLIRLILLFLLLISLAVSQLNLDLEKT